MANKREIRESPFEQGADEKIAYQITVPTSWGTATLSSIVNKLYEDPDGANTDRSDTMLSGVASASGQVITTQFVSGLTAGLKYRLETKFTTSEANILECYAIIFAQK